jgi:hypothetical protein
MSTGRWSAVAPIRFEKEANRVVRSPGNRLKDERHRHDECHHHDPNAQDGQQVTMHVAVVLRDVVLPMVDFISADERVLGGGAGRGLLFSTLGCAGDGDRTGESVRRRQAAASAAGLASCH